MAQQLVFELLFLAFFTLIACSSAKIIQVQYISRHCDRTPVAAFDPATGAVVPRTLPAEPINWQQRLGVTDGQLTGLGMFQCYTMGQQLRERYIDGADRTNLIAGIRTSFDVDHYQFMSTDYDRTIQSAQAASLALFPGNGPMDDLRNATALPHGVQPVPIYVLTRSEDNLLRGYETDKCQVIARNYQQYLAGTEYSTLYGKYDSFIRQVAKSAGFADGKFTLANFYELYDLVVVQKSHQALTLQPLLDAYDEVVRVGGFGSFVDTNRKVLGKLGGGPILQLILSRMQSMASTGKIQKYIQYSAHDYTILSVWAALNVNQDSLATNSTVHVPPYGSQLIFELHEDDLDASKHFVRIVYRRGYNGAFDYLTLDSLGSGCAKDCELNAFSSLLLAESIPADYCGECANTVNSHCVNNILLQKQTQGIVLGVVVGVLAAGNILLFVVLAGLVVCRCIKARTSKKVLRDKNINLPLIEGQVEPGVMYYQKQQDLC